MGLSGKDGNLVVARKLALTKTDPRYRDEKVLDLGFVGEPDADQSRSAAFDHESEIIPVIAPIGVGPKGETYNINADTWRARSAGA